MCLLAGTVPAGLPGSTEVDAARTDLRFLCGTGDPHTLGAHPDHRTVARVTDKRRRGELRIYLGAAPGVGKTFAMLGEAHRRAERGTDVVVGLVETHSRAKTEQLVEGLEILPRAYVEHRGHEFAELDVDGLLSRKPELAVVDELAHTNVPGSRNTKRWEDVEELLQAGIDVVSTVNVQHLESLNDVVQRITGIRQQETVPDDMVRRAEQIELVDITPEALRRRLAHGNIYAAHKIDAALGNYFRPGNLNALRELALLWMADQVDVALQRYRTEQQITDTWETRERVVAAVTGGPESETLIRRASRIAVRAGAELLVLQVLRGDGLGATGSQSSANLRRLAADVGSTFHTVVGDDVPTALLDFARGANATQLVLGTSRRSRFARLFDEGIGATTVQQSGPIDVHMVTHDQSVGRLRARLGRSPLTASRKTLGWTLAVVLPALATLIGAVWRHQVTFTTDVMTHLLVLVTVALVGGLGPALFASAVSVLLLDFFFVPPLYSLSIAEPENALALIATVVVAVIVALVVDGAARRGTQAATSRTEATLLASYARTVLTHPQPLNRLLEKVVENFGLTSIALLEKTDGEWLRVACVGEGPCDEPSEADVDVPVTADVHLALRGRALPAADRRVLEAAAGQALLALRQQRMTTEATAVHRRAATTELPGTLLSAAENDLREPLSTIRTALGSLREQLPDEKLAAAQNAADLLSDVVDELLDSAHLATGVRPVRLGSVCYQDIVARVLSAARLDEPVAVDIDEALPPVHADAGLLERVVACLVDNAVRYGTLTPRRRVDVDGDGRVAENEPIMAIRASEHSDQVELRIVDHGPGLPKGAAESFFTPPTDENNGRRLGFGLSVAKVFTATMGGTIRAEDTPGGGLTVVISLPH
jgi:two-component system sensor histidine kinase KdpD